MDKEIAGDRFVAQEVQHAQLVLESIVMHGGQVLDGDLTNIQGWRRR